MQFNPNGSKWEVEYQAADAGQLTVTIADKKETVYILGCIGANINVCMIMCVYLSAFVGFPVYLRVVT